MPAPTAQLTRTFLLYARSVPGRILEDKLQKSDELRLRDDSEVN